MKLLNPTGKNVTVDKSSGLLCTTTFTQGGTTVIEGTEGRIDSHGTNSSGDTVYECTWATTPNTYTSFVEGCCETKENVIAVAPFY